MAAAAKQEIELTFGTTREPHIIRVSLPEKAFELRGKNITTVPREIGNLVNLEKLGLYNNQLVAVPREIGLLENLKELLLHYNQLTALPSEIGNLVNLQTLDLHRNQLTALPREIGNLVNLQTLNLSYNQLTALPREIGNLFNLKTLILDDNKLKELPQEICQLINLKTLILHYNQLTALPSEIRNLVNLKTLILFNNPFTGDARLKALADRGDVNVTKEVLALFPPPPAPAAQSPAPAPAPKATAKSAPAPSFTPTTPAPKATAAPLPAAPPSKQSSVADVCRWLGSIGLGEITGCFETNRIDGSVLFDLTEADLPQIGITAFGHKKKLLSAIRDIHPAPSPSPDVAAAAPSPAAAVTPQQQEGVVGRMSFEQANVGVVPFATFPAGYAPKCSVHAAVARAMGAKWPTAFAAMLRGMVDRHVANTHGVRDAIAQHGLSEEEARAIAYYCADARMAGGTKEMSVFRELNSTLATRMFDKAATWHDFAVVLDSGLRKLPPFAGEVYRALDRPLTQLSRQYQAGYPVCWVAFTSCSKNKNCLKTFAGSVEQGTVSKGTWISLKVSSARDISALSMFPEDEVLLLPNTVLRVEEIVSSPGIKAMLNFPTNLDLVRVVEIQGAH